MVRSDRAVVSYLYLGCQQLVCMEVSRCLLVVGWAYFFQRKMNCSVHLMDPAGQQKRWHTPRSSACSRAVD